MPTESWSYNSQPIQGVNDFNYLGVVFNFTGNFKLNREYLVGNSLKAINVLFYHCRDFDLKPKISCQLLNACVGSTANTSGPP